MSSRSIVTASGQSLPAADQRTIWALSWPIILSNITVPLLGLVDTAILGHLDEIEPLAAVAIGAQLFTLLIWSFGFLRMGTTSLTARHLGGHGQQSTIRVLEQAVWLIIPVSLICLTLAYTLIPVVLPLYQASSEVTAGAGHYLAIRSAGIPLVLLQYALTGWFIGRGETRIPMVMLISANLINAAVDFLLVWHFSMGVAGVAIGSLCADATAVIVALAAAWQRGLRFPLRRPWFEFQRQMLRVNSDLFVRTFCLLMVFALFTALGARQSSEVLAANAILITLLLFISNALDGFAHATETLTGQYLGARHYVALPRICFLTLTDSALVAAGLAAILYWGGDTLLMLLTDQPALIPQLMDIHLWLWLLPVTGFLSYWLDGLMIGAQATRAMRNTMLIAAVVIFAPLATLPLWSENWHLTGVRNENTLLWIAFHVFLLARASLLFPTFLTLCRNPAKFS